MEERNFLDFSNEETKKIFLKKIEQNVLKTPSTAQIVRFPIAYNNIEEGLKFVKQVGKKLYSGFEIDEGNEFVCMNFLKWILADDTLHSQNENGEFVKGDVKKGIYLCGETGTGKSLLMQVMVEVSRNLNIGIETTMANTRRQPFGWQNIPATEISKEFQTCGNLEKYKYDNKNNTFRYIGIDDLGTEPKEVLYMGNRVNVLADFIEDRGNRHENLLFITSNLGMYSQKLKERYGERVQSRLKGMCNYFILDGKDRRK